MSFLTGLIDAAGKVIASIKGKAKISEIGLTVLGSLPAVLESLHDWQEADRFERIRQAWAELDLRTGLTGPDIVHDLPAEAEERLFDGIGAAGLELSLWAAGFYGDRPTLAQLTEANENLAGNLEALVYNAIKAPLKPATDPGPVIGSGSDNGSGPAAPEAGASLKVLELRDQLLALRQDPAYALKVGQRLSLIEDLVLELSRA